MTIISVQAIQTGMKKGHLWPSAQPITCEYDAFTQSLVPRAIDQIEQRIRDRTGGSLWLATQGIEEGDLKFATAIEPTADGRSLLIGPNSIWDRVKAATGNIELEPCPAAVAAPPPGVIAFAPAPPPPPPRTFDADVPGSLCFCVARLANGLYAMGFLDSPDHDTWSNTVAEGWIDATQIYLEYIPAVTGRLGDRYVWVHFPNADTHAEAIAAFAPLQEAITRFRSRMDIDAPPDCCPRREGSFAVAEQDVIPPEAGGTVVAMEGPSERASSTGLVIGLAVAGALGGAFLLLRKRRKRR